MTGQLLADYSWSRPSLQALHDVGYVGIARYLSHDTTGKNMTVEERDAALGLGMAIVLVWETYPTRPLEGFDAGVADAQAANAQADALGAPGCAIFYAVDFDAQGNDQFAAIGAYLQGAGSVGGRPIGVYGSKTVCEAMLDYGFARYGWQTEAWSHGLVSDRAHLYQRVGHTLPAVDGSYDENVVLNDDYGAWTNTPAPPPPPDPVPEPVPVPPAPDPEPVPPVPVPAPGDSCAIYKAMRADPAFARKLRRLVRSWRRLHPEPTLEGAHDGP